MQTTKPNMPTISFDAVDPAFANRGPSWFRPQREAALASFSRVGLPTLRDEDWRFTNIAPIRQTQFIVPGSTDAPEIMRADVKQFAIPGLDCDTFVFVNGRFCEELSRFEAESDDIRVMTLGEAMEHERPLVERHLNRHAKFESDPLTALNTALLGDGVFIHVPRGKSLSRPVHILNIAVPDEGAVLASPRNLILVDQSAEACVIEDYVALEDGVYFNNAVTEVVVGDNAKVTHYLLDRESNRAFNISALHVHQGRDSRFISHSMLFGGAIVRNNVHPILAGENCYSMLNGMYVIDGEQIADSHMRVEHCNTNGQSRQYYKGIMHDSAKGVFRGRIIVHPDAQKTDAKQSNRNLLLSDEASANTDPQLEIYADDVKCTHGATIGQINETQVFYLMSRGIPRQTARAMIIVAFASESLNRIEHEPIKKLMQSMLIDCLPESQVLDRNL